MDKRRSRGITIMAIGALIGLIGKITGGPEAVEIVEISLATFGILAGGAIVIFSYRAELARPLSTSRVSLLASTASLKGAAALGHPTERADAAGLELYAHAFSAEMERCEELLSGGASRGDLEEARDRLMSYVANPRYGEATGSGRIGAERVRRLSERLRQQLLAS